MQLGFSDRNPQQDRSVGLSATADSPARHEHVVTRNSIVQELQQMMTLGENTRAKLEVEATPEVALQIIEETRNLLHQIENTLNCHSGLVRLAANKNVTILVQSILQVDQVRHFLREDLLRFERLHDIGEHQILKNDLPCRHEAPIPTGVLISPNFAADLERAYHGRNPKKKTDWWTARRQAA